MDRRRAREDARLSAEEVDAYYERLALMYWQPLLTSKLIVLGVIATTMVLINRIFHLR